MSCHNRKKQRMYLGWLLLHVASFIEVFVPHFVYKMLLIRKASIKDIFRDYNRESFAVIIRTEFAKINTRNFGKYV